MGISSHVSCQVPFGKIRAIFPMLWNAPTSTHSELCALVGKVLERVEQMHQHQTRVQAAPSNESSCTAPEQPIVAQGSGRGYHGIKSQGRSQEGDIHAEAVASTLQSVTKPGGLVGQASISGRGARQPLPEGASGDLIQLMRQMVEDHRKAGCSPDE